MKITLNCVFYTRVSQPPLQFIQIYIYHQRETRHIRQTKKALTSNELERRNELNRNRNREPFKTFNNNKTISNGYEKKEIEDL